MEVAATEILIEESRYLFGLEIKGGSSRTCFLEPIRGFSNCNDAVVLIDLGELDKGVTCVCVAGGMEVGVCVDTPELAFSSTLSREVCSSK